MKMGGGELWVAKRKTKELQQKTKESGEEGGGEG